MRTIYHLDRVYGPLMPIPDTSSRSAATLHQENRIKAVSSTWPKVATALVSEEMASSYERKQSKRSSSTVQDKMCLIVSRVLPAQCLRSGAISRFQPGQPYRRVPNQACIMPTMVWAHGQKEFGAFAAVKSGKPVRAFGQENWLTTSLSSSSECKA